MDDLPCLRQGCQAESSQQADVQPLMGPSCNEENQPEIGRDNLNMAYQRPQSVYSEEFQDLLKDADRTLNSNVVTMCPAKNQNSP